MHVLCGACGGVVCEEPEAGRAAITAALRAVRNMVTRGTSRRPPALGTGRAPVVRLVDTAQRAVAKTRVGSTVGVWQVEREAVLRFLAGDIGDVGPAGDEARGKAMARRVSNEIRAAQQAAATLRKAWDEAGKEERARRAEREGGALGRRWRGVGMETWRQAMRAMQVETEETHADQQPKACAAHGWTMASALIKYKLREQRRAEERRAARADEAAESTPAAEGEGVVVFDVETTRLIEADTRLAEMEVSVACALVLPHANSTQASWATAERHSFWHEHATHRRDRAGGGDGVAELLRLFDAATLLVAYNGRAFDMEVLRSHYEGDEARRQSHLRKLRDPFEIARRAAGRPVRLATLLKLNGQAGKMGAGCDAPGLWADGKLEQLERYCQRDVEALAELVTRGWTKVPGGGGTDHMDVSREIKRGATIEQDEAAHARGAEAAAAPREKRARAVESYDQVARRAKRRRRGTGVAYVTGHKRSRVALRHSIEVGQVTVHRVVAGAYEWRDAGYRARAAKKARAWEGSRIWDPGD